MLTKQEREEIAERFRNYDKAEYVTLYSGMYDGLLGEHVPKETTVKKDRMELTKPYSDFATRQTWLSCQSIKTARLSALVTRCTMLTTAVEV